MTLQEMFLQTHSWAAQSSMSLTDSVFLWLFLHQFVSQDKMGEVIFTLFFHFKDFDTYISYPQICQLQIYTRQCDFKLVILFVEWWKSKENP